MKAYCLIRSQPVYRREAFAAGLARHGYEVRLAWPPQRIEHGDVLVIWNRYAEWHDVATRFEKAGGIVLVAENAYLGLDRNDRRRYAIASYGHNGSGCWHVGQENRFAELGIPVLPWRTEGKHVLVCPNRSFGRPDLIMPPDWAQDVARRLQQYTRRTVRIRPHPGNDPPRIPLVDDLKDAWAVVIWSSSAGCEALVRGIPVFCEGPRWICKAATQPIREIESPKPLPDRAAALHALAWAQWHVEEIENGTAFEHLLHRPQAFAGGL